MKLQAEWPGGGGGAAGTPLTAGEPAFSWKQIFPVRVKHCFLSVESVVLPRLCLYLQTKCLISQNVSLISVSERGVGLTMIKLCRLFAKGEVNPGEGLKSSSPKSQCERILMSNESSRTAGNPVCHVWEGRPQRRLGVNPEDCQDQNYSRTFQ